MRFSLYIARRYTISRSKSTAVNIITIIATLGIIASTAALFIIMSAFSGLREFSVSFTNATDPDLKLTTAVGKSFTISPQQQQQLNGIKAIQACSRVVEERVLFYFDNKEQVSYLKGVDSLYTTVSPIKEHLAGGQWIEPYNYHAVVGGGIFTNLSLGLFDMNRSLEVYVPKPGKGTVGEKDFNKEALMVVGVYLINDDVDSKYVFCDLELAQKLLQFKENQYTSLEMKLAPGADENDVKQQLTKIFGDNIVLRNRAQLNDSLYKMLNAENLVTYLFCFLVVVLALFCLAGALIMLILDKKENIKTMYSLGAEVKNIRRIFLYQGIFITSIGAFFGLALSSLIIFLQQQFALVLITPTMAYPVAFTMFNVLIVLATIFGLGIIASYIAATRVNKKLLENS
ncbi:ABC transporter permease [Flavobacterium rhizosphaerae]|uniref:FtsX-like permease family protein n=1 Tax=Flavobacterium rhizosphaerae TaxID=3163298 RepID=A0ABW8YYK5_9FLAO